MPELARADIFFTISAAGFVIITIGFVVVFYYLVSILRSVHKVIEKARDFRARDILKSLLDLI